VRSDGTSWHVVEGLEHSAFATSHILASAAELVAERDEAAALLG
jgi:hypothetical protein